MGGEMRPPAANRGPLGWVRANLLNTWHSAVLSAALLAGGWYLLRGFGGWALQTAQWAVVTQNLQVLLVGQYPDEEVWRAGAVMLALPFVLGLGWSAWPGFCRQIAVSLAVAAPLLALLPVEFASLAGGFRLFGFNHRRSPWPCPRRRGRSRRIARPVPHPRPGGAGRLRAVRRAGARPRRACLLRRAGARRASG